VLQAAEETENGISHFLNETDRSRLLGESVTSLQLAVNTVLKQYKEGGIDFTRVSQVEQDLVQQQDAQAASQGQVAQGLIEVYRALGGGWQSHGRGPTGLPEEVPNPLPENVRPSEEVLRPLSAEELNPLPEPPK
jgi:outer membrane protein TolC